MRNRYAAIVICILCFAVAPACSKGPQTDVLLKIEGQERGSQLGWLARQFVDLDGDTIPEIAAASTSPLPLAGIGVYSGATGQEIYRINSELNNYIVKLFTFTSDLNGDSIPEIAAPDTGSSPCLVVFSGKDGTLLFQTDEKLRFDHDPPRVLSLPDKNGDGIPDIALEQPTRSLLIFSGKDGKKIDELEPPKDGEDIVLYNVAPDIDGDGFSDIIGLHNVNRVPQACFYSSKDFSHLSEMFPIPVQMRPTVYACADLNDDAFPDIALVHHTGGKPEGSLLVALSGKDGRELWRVNGTDVDGGSKMLVVDAGTKKMVGAYRDIKFADSLAVLPDMNGDGVPEIATGHADFFDREHKIAGCVFIFSGKDGQLLRSILSPDNSCRIGVSVAAFADANFDGVSDLLLGAPTAAVAERKEAGCVLLMRM